MSRFKMVISYDGTKFLGWQIQKEGRTVQNTIEDALKIISGGEERIIVHGSGRTDAGVHALAQVAHFDFNTKLKVKDIKNALNANLPKDCRIIDVNRVPSDFHSRFDAKVRYYKYQCYLGESILFRNQCWVVNKANVQSLNDVASQLIGVHDFLSFCKYREEMKDTRCEVFDSQWLIDHNMIIFRISANRFLHHMIRYLVGTMIAVCDGRLTKKDFSLLLNKPKKNVRIFKAPPQGLIFEKVIYDK
mgnify:FL=1